MEWVDWGGLGLIEAFGDNAMELVGVGWRKFNQDRARVGLCMGCLVGPVLGHDPAALPYPTILFETY